MGIGQYNNLGEYYGPDTASSVCSYTGLFLARTSVYLNIFETFTYHCHQQVTIYVHTSCLQKENFMHRVLMFEKIITFEVQRKGQEMLYTRRHILHN